MKSSKVKYFVVKQETNRVKIGNRTVYVTTDEREAKAMQDRLDGIGGYSTSLASIER